MDTLGHKYCLLWPWPSYNQFIHFDITADFFKRWRSISNCYNNLRNRRKNLVTQWWSESYWLHDMILQCLMVKSLKSDYWMLDNNLQLVCPSFLVWSTQFNAAISINFFFFFTSKHGSYSESRNAFSLDKQRLWDVKSNKCTDMMYFLSGNWLIKQVRSTWANILSNIWTKIF